MRMTYGQECSLTSNLIRSGRSIGGSLHTRNRQPFESKENYCPLFITEVRIHQQGYCYSVRRRMHISLTFVLCLIVELLGESQDKGKKTRYP